VLQVGGRQKHVSRSGAMSYQETDQSATDSMTNGNSSTREITLRVIKLEMMKTVNVRKQVVTVKSAKLKK
jgi:hypothetical protein